MTNPVFEPGKKYYFKLTNGKNIYRFIGYNDAGDYVFEYLAPMYRRNLAIDRIIVYSLDNTSFIPHLKTYKEPRRYKKWHPIISLYDKIRISYQQFDNEKDARDYQPSLGVPNIGVILVDWEEPQE